MNNVYQFCNTIYVNYKEDMNMDEDQIIEEIVDLLDNNGEVRISGDGSDIFIESVDDKEGYAYISNTNKEFESSHEAIEWAVEQFDGVESINDWE
jgi:hypothetical protein